MSESNNYLAYVDYLTLRRAYNKVNKSVDLDLFLDHLHETVGNEIDADLLRAYFGFLS